MDIFLHVRQCCHRTCSATRPQQSIEIVVVIFVLGGLCEGLFLGFNVVVVEGLKVESVAEQCTDATEAFDELGTFLGVVGDELETATKVFVVFSEPFNQRDFLNNIEILARVLVFEQRCVVLLGRGNVKDFLRPSIQRNHYAECFEVFEDNESMNGAAVKGKETVTDTEAVFASVLSYFSKEGREKLFFLDKFDVLEGVFGEIDSLIESVFQIHKRYQRS